MKKIVVNLLPVIFSAVLLSGCASTTVGKELTPNENVAVVSAMGDTADFITQHTLSEETYHRDLPGLKLDAAISQTIVAALRSQGNTKIQIITLPKNNPIAAMTEASKHSRAWFGSDSDLDPAVNYLKTLTQGKSFTKVVVVMQDNMRKDPVTLTGDDGPIGYGYDCHTFLKARAVWYAGYGIMIFDVNTGKFTAGRAAHPILDDAPTDLCGKDPQNIPEQNLVAFFNPLRAVVIETVTENMQPNTDLY